MATQGYTFHIDGIELPITPSAVSIKVGNKNKSVELANGSDMTVLKSPSLTEISFTARLPQTNIFGNQRLPFGNAGMNTAEAYIDHLRNLKANKKVFQFIITRSLPSSARLFDTNFSVVLETFTVKEDATNGFDILVDITMKQYVHHVTKVLTQTNGNTNTTERIENPPQTSTTYVIKAGDTLWSIAKRFFNSPLEWKTIYDANKEVIEAEAKRGGKASSSQGYWIYPGTEIVVVKGTSK